MDFIPFNGTVFLDASTDRMACNITCCQYEDPDGIICFINYNFSDYYNVTEKPEVEMIARWTYAVLVFIAGIIGNIVVIHILLANRLLLRTTVNIFILNMSIADLILAVCGSIPFTIGDTELFWVLGEVWCHLEGFSQVTMMVVSVFSLTIISFDRMIGVTFPFHKHLSLRQSLFVILLVWICGPLLAAPFAIYRIYSVRVWADVVETTCQETSRMVTWWHLTMAIIMLVPLSVMITCYVIIFLRFKFFNRSVGRNSPAMGELTNSTSMAMKKKVVKMMFVVVIVFICCWLPLLVFVMTKKYFLLPDGSLSPDKEKAYNTFLTVANYAVYLNPVFDPIIYGLMHESFQRAFRVTYSCIYKRKSNFFLTRGVGNRGYMWSTKTNTPQHSRNSRGLRHTPPSMKEKENKPAIICRLTKWFGKNAAVPESSIVNHQDRHIPNIPRTIMEGSKESHSASCTSEHGNTSSGKCPIQELSSCLVSKLSKSSSTSSKSITIISHNISISQEEPSKSSLQSLEEGNIGESPGLKSKSHLHWNMFGISLTSLDDLSKSNGCCSSTEMDDDSDEYSKTIL